VAPATDVNEPADYENSNNPCLPAFDRPSPNLTERHFLARNWLVSCRVTLTCGFFGPARVHFGRLAAHRLHK